MSALEIAVIIIAAGIVAAVVITSIVRKIKGKPSLSSDCCGCPYSKNCNHACGGCSGKSTEPVQGSETANAE